jgi:hypothetical protein
MTDKRDSRRSTCGRYPKYWVDIPMAVMKDKDVKPLTYQDFDERVKKVYMQHQTDESGVFYHYPTLINVFIAISESLKFGNNVAVLHTEQLPLSLADDLISTMQIALPRDQGYFVERNRRDLVVEEKWNVVILFGKFDVTP